MKYYFTVTISFFVFISVYASQTRKVLLIGIDGCRSDALQQANTPHIDSLLSTSLYSFDSWHTGITWSGPSWSTILTGVQWNKHGVTENTFNGSKLDSFPAFPKLAKELKPNLKCVEVVEWDPLADEFNNSGWNKKIKTTDGSTFPTADSAIVQLQDPDIDVLFTYFDKVDLTGHLTTFSPTNSLYINAIQNVDTAIGMVLNALYARPTYADEDWLILLITDHGGKGFTHGGNSNEERHIWWIANGSSIMPQHIDEADPGTYNCHLNNAFDTTCVDYALLRQSPTHPDIAVTALHYLIFDTGVNPETKPEWKLDGKSWLTIPNGIKQTGEDALIQVSPNPASETVSIAWDKRQDAEVTLSNMQGQLIARQDIFDDGTTFSLHNIAAGYYILTVRTEKARMTKKVVVLK